MALEVTEGVGNACPCVCVFVRFLTNNMPNPSFEIWIQHPTYLSLPFLYQVTFSWVSTAQQLKPYV